MEFENDSGQWNMAFAFMQRIDRRLDERDRVAAAGDLMSWYRINKNIFNNIIFRFRENDKHLGEEEELINLFKTCENQLMNTNVDQRARSLQLGIAERTLNEIDLKLNNILYVFELIMPVKKNWTLKEHLESDY